MRVTWATAQNLPWWWLHVEAVGLWYFLEPYAESEIEQACRSFPLLYPRVLRNLSHLRSGAQVAINKEDSKSAHISKEKGQASSRPWELKASPKPPPQSVYWLLCRALRESSGVRVSLSKTTGHTHTLAIWGSDLHGDYCPDSVVDLLVGSKLSEKERGNTPGSGSHCRISVS